MNNPIVNHIFDIIGKNNYYTISQHFGIKIEETWTCLTFYAEKFKVLNNDPFILSLEEISEKERK